MNEQEFNDNPEGVVQYEGTFEGEPEVYGEPENTGQVTEVTEIDEAEEKVAILPPALREYLDRAMMTGVALIIYFWVLTKVPTEDGIIWAILMGAVLTVALVAFLRYIKSQLLWFKRQDLFHGLRLLKELRERARANAGK